MSSRQPHRLRALLMFVFCLGASLAMPAGAAYGSAAPLSAADLDQLVAPIALYPDALVAQILPASTYPVEIVEAARTVVDGAKPNASTMSQWDPSVQALVSTPSVLKMMNDRIQWTTDLGQAVSQDQNAVMGAVQRVRAEAKKAGNLDSNSQQVVTTQGDTIIIAPADPQVIYVPQYDPVAILAPAPPAASYGLMTFGVGFAAGALTAYACDWGGDDHWGGSNTLVVNKNYNYANVHNTNINSIDRNSYSSWKAPADVGRVTASSSVRSYDNSDLGDSGHSGDDADRGDSGDRGNSIPENDRAGGGGEEDRGGGMPDNVRAGGGSGTGGDRAGSGGGNMFSGSGGGGWQARSASDRGAESSGGGDFGSGRGGGGFRGGGGRR